MFRHYLPSIAAAIALLIALIVIPIGGELATENPRLKSSVVSAQSITPGDGLAATYYSVWNCTGTSKTRVDPQIHFGYQSIDTDPVYYDPCIKWRGQIYVSGGTGDYTFFISHDDGAKLTVNNTEIYNSGAWYWEGTYQPSSTIRLEERHRYDISVDFYDFGAGGQVSLKWSGPGVSEQVIPQSVLYSTRTQCSDSVDNDNDGKTDYPADPGCESAHDNDETNPACNDGKDNDQDGRIDMNDPGCSDIQDNDEYNPPAPLCSDGVDNDADGKIDYPSDPGCSSLTDTDETDPPKPACSDTLDNDSDGKIDYPADPGCTSVTDTDEVDPPTEKIVTLKKNIKPLIIVYPLLLTNEKLKFQTTCATCTIQTSLDPQNYIGGTPLANAGFYLIATLLDSSDNSKNHTIVAVGNFQQQSKIFNNKGQEYLGAGDDQTNQYPIGILANYDNGLYVRTTIDNQVMPVMMSPLLLPRTTGASLINGTSYYYFLNGEDGNGKGHLAVIKGRHWDLDTITDAALTPEPFRSFFASRGTLSQCVQSLQNYPAKESLLDSVNSFQLLLDLLSLCQR